MGASVLIAGSGKIARDAGMYFLKQGNAVSWVSRNETRLVDLQGYVDAAVHAFMATSRGSVRSLSASFFLYDELAQEKFDAIIECTNETLVDKKDVATRLAGHIGAAGIFASTSLSIPLSDIHPACMGLRVRFPLDLLKSAELVFQKNTIALQKGKLADFCRANGISCTG
jgi:3-hydroxyacyl-CoA dehydrogenase